MINDYMQTTLAGCYGAQVLTSDVKKWLLDNLCANMDREIRVSLNIWSAPGVGKTSLVKSLTNESVTWRGRKWQGFKVIDIPLAQIEEMGDVLGFPVEEIKMTAPDGSEMWIKAVDTLIRAYLDKGFTADGTQRTRYAPPAWVPTEECPGILLFDDGNRASQRIMKGLMQLVQDYRTISWELPKGWTIVFTGNPDNRMNQVTSMDAAQLSRMKHITLLPDVHEWVKWAETQNDVDERLIAFLLKNPEMMIGGERTNPRSLTEFGRALKRFPDIANNKEQYKLCETEAAASLDSDAVNAIMVFLIRDVELVISPEMIINDAEQAVARLKTLMESNEPRLDIAHISNSRLLACLTSGKEEYDQTQIGNIQQWLIADVMPEDMVFAFIKLLWNSNTGLAKKILMTNTELKKFVGRIVSGKDE